MINTEEFTIRLQEIFNYYGINAAGFSEKIGIGRSSVSHIVSGRNKPSLDFVMHVLEYYPEITFDWLVYGKGKLGNIDKNTENRLFETKSDDSPNNEILDTTPNLFENTENTVRKSASLPVETPNLIMDAEVDFITIFYKDGTFKKYTSK